MTASAIAVTTPFPLFNDIDGQPLENGRIWIGQPGLPPKTNPKEIYWDAGFVGAADQPVRTKGGYPQNSGSPRRFYVDGDYSILVENKNGAPVYGAETNNIPSFYAARTFDVCSVRDFGAPGTGNAVLDTKAFEDAIAFAAQVVTTGPIDYDNVTAAVRIPAGKYILSRTIELANCVSIIGDGSGAVEIFVEHTGIGFRAPDGATYANILLEGFKMTSGGSATQAIYYEGMIRGCVTRDVFPVGFVDSFYTTNTWTNRFENCQSLSPTRSHFRFETGTGLQWIEGGRFDEAVGFGVYANSAEAEIVITGNAAIQFGRTAGIRIDNAPTIVLDGVFVEGNCISNVTNYHIELFRPDAPVSNNLTSASIKGVTINNRADPLRNGLGIMSVRNYKTFTYEERWVRNGVSEVPTIGVGVENVNLSINSATDRTAALSHLVWNSQNHVMLRQVARPTFIGGEDMLSGGPGTSNPEIRAALNVGLNTVGVALGTSNQVSAVQSYGGALRINPDGYDIQLGSTTDAKVVFGTNEVWARHRNVPTVTASSAVPAANVNSVFMDCTAAPKTVTLTNHLPAAGRTFRAGKTDASANGLQIIPTSGALIDGAATYTITAARGSVWLESDGTDWFITAKSF